MVYLPTEQTCLVEIRPKPKAVALQPIKAERKVIKNRKGFSKDSMLNGQNKSARRRAQGNYLPYVQAKLPIGHYD